MVRCCRAQSQNWRRSRSKTWGPNRSHRLLSRKWNRNIPRTFRWARYPSNILAWRRRRIHGDGIWASRPKSREPVEHCGRRFSLKTVLLLADQLLSRFQYIHSKGYIHRDVTPDNLLMGDGKQGNTVYVTDIGFAKEIEHNNREWHSGYGTLRYSSINAQLQKCECLCEHQQRGCLATDIETQSSFIAMIWSLLDTSSYTFFEVPSPGRVWKPNPWEGNLF